MATKLDACFQFCSTLSTLHASLSSNLFISPRDLSIMAAQSTMYSTPLSLAST